MSRRITLPDFNGVGPNKKATLQVPAVGTYEAIYLRFPVDTSGNMKELAKRITLKIDGNVQRVYDDDIFKALQHLNYGDNNAYYEENSFGDFFEVPIHFSEPWLRTALGEDALAWGMADVSTFTVEIEGGSDLVDVKASAEWRPIDRPLGMIRKIKEFIVPSAGVGKVSVQNLPRTDIYTKLILFRNNNNQQFGNGTVKVEVDGTTQYEFASAWDTKAWLKRHGLFFNSNDLYLPFDIHRRAGQGLSMMRADGKAVQRFSFEFAAPEAGNYRLVAETLGNRD